MRPLLLAAVLLAAAPAFADCIANGHYTIVGTHTYNAPGTFTIRVTFFEKNDPTFTVSAFSSASVS